MIEYIDPSGIALAAATYSHVVKVTNATQIFVAGQVALDENGRIVGIRDIEQQTHQALQNIRACLEAAGASMNDVIYRTTYVTSMDDCHKIFAIWPQYFDHLPPGTLLQVTSLYPKDAMIEIEVTAVID